jgi:hypothetical protein
MIYRRFKRAAHKNKAPILEEGRRLIDSPALLLTDQAMPMKDRTARTMTTAPTSHTMLFMTVSFQCAPGGSKASDWLHSINQANPTRFSTAMTMTTAPTNQTMLFMTFSF